GRLMRREDADAAALVVAALRADGVRVLEHTEAVRCEVDGDEQRLVVRHGNGMEEAIPFDALLCAVGRVANTTGYGLEELGIPVTRQRTVETTEYLQTLYPIIY
ncbi:pyridine nucleotide-disulfide oxidoreductase, partial [Citrobacter sp. AAK_AS5]